MISYIFSLSGLTRQWKFFFLTEDNDYIRLKNQSLLQV